PARADAGSIGPAATTRAYPARWVSVHLREVRGAGVERLEGRAKDRTRLSTGRSPLLSHLGFSRCRNGRLIFGSALQQRRLDRVFVLLAARSRSGRRQKELRRWLAALLSRLGALLPPAAAPATGGRGRI